MKAVIINSDGLVENVVQWTETSSLPEGVIYVLVADDFYVGPGFTTTDGETFLPPPPLPE